VDACEACGGCVRRHGAAAAGWTSSGDVTEPPSAAPEQQQLGTSLTNQALSKGE